MIPVRRRHLVHSLAFAACLGACSAEPAVIGAGTEAEPEAVPLGKEDNFLAQTAREYLVEGRTTVTLEAESGRLTQDEQLAQVKRLIPFRQVVVAWFLNAYVSPKDPKDKNAKYGGFSALTKNGSFEELLIRPTADPLVWEFTFRQELAGPLDLLDKLPVNYGPGGEMTFDLQVGKVSTEDMQNLKAATEWFRSKPWADFTPDNVTPDQLETLPLTITAQPRSSDAWLDTIRLFEDGKVTVAVHFGWDYHSASHLSESKLLFKWLVEQGYRAPEASWDTLGRKSGPFTRTIQAGGKPVQVEIAVFFGKPGTDTDPDTDAGARQLRRDMIKSFESREVIIYSGHSGPFWGFSLGNWKKTEEGELEDNELTTMDLPESYQLVLAEGCETYAIGQAFFDNPAKASRKNIDIITTTTYSTASDADPVKDFLGAVVGTWDDGRHAPWTFGELLKDLDWNAWDAAMYGVHGIDDNPHLHPYADPSKFCGTCASDSDCGAEGNFCVRLGTDGRVCTAECTGDDGCPGGYVCAAIARGQSITGRACIPRSFSCTTDDEPTRELIVNEIMADPPTGLSGDHNGDGTTDPDQDEFIELVNVSRKSLKIGGWTVADGSKVRFTFPQGVTLPRGGVAVVYGGGEPASREDIGALVFKAGDGLSFANLGDSAIVRSADGRVIDRVVFGAEADDDVSLTRLVDGDAETDFVHHADVPASPATKQDLTPF